MSDSCFEGMKQITEMIATRTGQYGVCVPTGDSRIVDTERGFFMTMDKSVEVLAENQTDPKLQTVQLRGLLRKFSVQRIHSEVQRSSCHLF